MAILITGGTGFLGSYITRHFVLEKGVKDLVIFDRFPELSRIAEVQDAVTVVRGDVLEPQEILETIERHQIDRIIHLAFLAGAADPMKIPPYLRLECMGTANVFEAARIAGIKPVCNASSMAVYGSRPREQPVTEDAPLAPEGTYGVCKVWTEGIAQVHNQQHGMEIISLRICASLGLGRLGRASLASGLMPPDDQPYFMANPERAALGEPVTMPRMARSWISSTPPMAPKCGGWRSTPRSLSTSSSTCGRSSARSVT